MEKTLYKIRRRSDGLFSIGGSWPRFNKFGKVWSNKGPLHNHIRLTTYYDSINGEPVYKDCDIIEYELKELKTTNAMDYIYEHKLYRSKD